MLDQASQNQSQIYNKTHTLVDHNEVVEVGSAYTRDVVTAESNIVIIGTIKIAFIVSCNFVKIAFIITFLDLFVLIHASSI